MKTTTMTTAEKVIKGTFTSFWAEGEIETSARLFPDGSLDIETSEDGDDFEHLEREKFEDENGNEYPVCQFCHNHIMKMVMVPGVGKTLHEEMVCTNPDCENR